MKEDRGEISSRSVGGGRFPVGKVHSFIHSLIYSLIHPLNHFYPQTQPTTQPPGQPPTHPLNKVPAELRAGDSALNKHGPTPVGSTSCRVQILWVTRTIIEGCLRVRTSLVAQLVKNPPAIQETWVQSLGWEDPLEKEFSSGLENSMEFKVHGVTKSWT